MKFSLKYNFVACINFNLGQSILRNILLSFSLLVILTGCEQPAEVKREIEMPKRSSVNKAGTVFTPLPKDLFAAPIVTEIELDVPDSIDALWGATGRDDNGLIYFGTSSHGGDYGSAFLYQYDPETGAIVKQSDVVTELKRNNVYSEGMRQNKLHSKFYQADDGYLYFSSFDEGGEAEGINPKWGGNLWRKLPNDKHWQHVLATEEALVAINTNGRYVYALGYWNHVLYQYDTTTTTKVKKVTVGSTQMHVSRNFIVDQLGHAYVPQLKMNDFNEIEVALAEYDNQLNFVNFHPLPSYQSNDFENHHGIVGYTSMKNSDIYFTSADGGLYLIRPFEKPAQKVQYKGMMHPDGKAYIASLFSIDGEGVLVGIAKKKKSKYEWVIYDSNLQLASNTLMPLNDVKKPLLYGSLTRDNNGAFYVVGWQKKQESGHSPLLLKVVLD
jgi:hypothetical protein